MRELAERTSKESCSSFGMRSAVELTAVGSHSSLSPRAEPAPPRAGRAGPVGLSQHSHPLLVLRQASQGPQVCRRGVEVIGVCIRFMEVTGVCV